MEKEQRIFLAYRAVFEGSNAQIRQPKAIKKLVSQHRMSAHTLLHSLGEKQVIDTLKILLDRKIFQSELEAKLAFPRLFTISSSQSEQHIASEADAARSEAEALDDVASLHGHEDDAQDKIIDEPPSALTTAENHADVHVQTASNVIHKPSLYPIYIPFKIQYLVLSRAQSLLEECCYNFTVQWLPDLLEQRHWDCPEAIELNKWTHIMAKRLGKLPSQAFARDSNASLTQMLMSINKLRHSAVHRLPTTAKGISEMIGSATRFANALRDSTRGQQLDELHRELEGKIRALELNKNFLETKLEGELQDIAKQRRELDEKEKEAVATMLKEDKDHGSLIGGLLSTSIKHIFKKLDQQELELTEAEASSDYETDAKEGQEHPGELDLGYQAELQSSTKTHVAIDHDTELELPESKAAQQPFDKTLHGVQSLPDMSADSRIRIEQVHDGLHPEVRRLSTLESQRIADPESELMRQPPETKNGGTESEPNTKRQDSIEQEPYDDKDSREEQNIHAGTPSQEIDRPYVNVIDAKLGTGTYSKLSDKRLQKLCRYVQKQTHLGTALNQNELENLIHARFATFESEKRQRSNATSKKGKKSKQSTTHTDDSYHPLEPDEADSPPKDQPVPPQSVTTDAQPPPELSSRSSSPLKELLIPDLSQPLNEPSSLSLPCAESVEASEPKTYQLTVVGDAISPGGVGLLWIDKNGRVEGKMVVDKSGISLL